MMRSLGLLIVLLLSVACSKTEQSSFANIELSPQQLESISEVKLTSAFSSAAELFAQHANDEMVKGQGEVVRLLAGDNKGPRHQKFLVEVGGGQTLLFAHNIDLALRINALKVGDNIELRGEYSYNPKGGVVHWTQLDPKNQHEAGWIKHNGITYQ
ncbi:MAG: DUF3465 domain-containing protein [Methylophilaceae bacterium]|nr:DUF3465 domain-containing protein [Methylophilaceae bacterium]